MMSIVKLEADILHRYKLFYRYVWRNINILVLESYVALIFYKIIFCQYQVFVSSSVMSSGESLNI
jgi:hypothetical protein